jgi:hypothetical protein
MTFNFRNAEFESDNVEQDEFSSFDQTDSDQTTNQSAADQSQNNSRSNESISDQMFTHAQRVKIADIVTAALRMNRQNNSFSDISSVSSSMTSIFETRLDR